MSVLTLYIAVSFLLSTKSLERPPIGGGFLHNATRQLVNVVCREYYFCPCYQYRVVEISHYQFYKPIYYETVLLNFALVHLLTGISSIMEITSIRDSGTSSEFGMN